jgi:hypothetical protein
MFKKFFIYISIIPALVAGSVFQIQIIPVKKQTPEQACLTPVRSSEMRR